MAALKPVVYDALIKTINNLHQHVRSGVDYDITYKDVFSAVYAPEHRDAIATVSQLIPSTRRGGDMHFYPRGSREYQCRIAVHQSPEFTVQGPVPLAVNGPMQGYDVAGDAAYAKIFTVVAQLKDVDLSWSEAVNAFNQLFNYCPNAREMRAFLPVLPALLEAHVDIPECQVLATKIRTYKPPAENYFSADNIASFKRANLTISMGMLLPKTYAEKRRSVSISVVS